MLVGGVNVILVRIRELPTIVASSRSKDSRGRKLSSSYW